MFAMSQCHVFKRVLSDWFHCIRLTAAPHTQRENNKALHVHGSKRSDSSCRQATASSFWTWIKQRRTSIAIAVAWPTYQQYTPHTQRAYLPASSPFILDDYESCSHTQRAPCGDSSRRLWELRDRSRDERRDVRRRVVRTMLRRREQRRLQQPKRAIPHQVVLHAPAAAVTLALPRAFQRRRFLPSQHRQQEALQLIPTRPLLMQRLDRSWSAKLIILNAKILVLSAQFLVFNPKFMIFLTA